MMRTSLYRLVALAGVALAAGSANAQQAPTKWVPTRESVTVSAMAAKNYRVILSASHLSSGAFVVSASMPVPYSDLNLARDPDAAEFDRRIHVAAHLVCLQLDIKYPPSQYPIADGYSGFECEHEAAKDGMAQADVIIASARK